MNCCCDSVLGFLIRLQEVNYLIRSQDLKLVTIQVQFGHVALSDFDSLPVMGGCCDYRERGLAA